MLQAFVGLDGYFAHLQRPQIVNGKQVENISLSIAVGGLGYEVWRHQRKLIMLPSKLQLFT